MILFGPAGTDDNFAASGFKSTQDMPKYLHGLGLTAFEYQCGRGVRISQANAKALGEQGRQYGVALSIHAPYYISLSGAEEEKRLNSVGYILQAARAVDWMGGDRIVVHSGSVGKLSRPQALELAKETMKLALDALDGEKLSHIHVCPETMGKVGQLGDLDEVMELCLLDERMLPCIDFGHLNARTFGGYNTRESIATIFDAMENRLGAERAARFHAHFSRIEFTEKGGEKRHWTLADTQFGPDFAPVADLLVERGARPVIICESSGTQSLDALEMKRMVEERATGSA